MNADALSAGELLAELRNVFMVLPKDVQVKVTQILRDCDIKQQSLKQASCHPLLASDHS